MYFWKFPSYYNGPKSDHFDGEVFFNPWHKRQMKLWDLVRWRLSANPKAWPKNAHNFLRDVPPKKVFGKRLRVSFVGHSTVLIQTQGLNIITDPVWAKGVSPIRWPRIQRVSAPGITFENLPPIDIVLVSHNHYDHLDRRTICRLWQRDKPLVIAPIGNDGIIHSFNSKIEVKTLDWNQSLKIKEGVYIHLEPAQHWSKRWLWDTNKALWGAFVVETPAGNIYFAGDTGYGKGHTFKIAKEKFGDFRFAMLPIGAYNPRWFMEYVHMSPRDALNAFEDLGCPYTMPIHFRTFRLSDEGFDDPVKELFAAKTARSQLSDRFRVLEIGEHWEIPESD